MIAFRSQKALASLAAAAVLVAPGRAAGPVQGVTAAKQVARAYDAILDADFARLPEILNQTCPPAPTEACVTLDALETWWRISLDPESRALDRSFLDKASRAIAAAEAWTLREPERAEAFFYVGAAYGARVQWRVLRGERLAAARDGKRIKDALERALVLDPGLHDARFGVGLYRYYAAIAPAGLRMLRWLFMLPGGDREGGLTEIMAARDRGTLVRGEADYQLHILYLWYEKRFDDALALIQSLQVRYPRNPLFFQAEADIHTVYFHDPTSALLTSQDLLQRARAGLMNEHDLAEARAHVMVAVALDRLFETDRALDHLDWVIRRTPPRPSGSVQRAAALAAQMRGRLAREAYRVGLEGWRAFERGDLDLAAAGLTRSLALENDPVARYRYAQVLLAREDPVAARAELERTLQRGSTPPPVTMAAAHFDLAQILADSGDRDGARSHFEAASQVFGADPRVKTAAAREIERLRLNQVRSPGASGASVR